MVGIVGALMALVAVIVLGTCSDRSEYRGVRRLASLVALSTAWGMLAGCSVPPRGPAVPQADTARALPLGIPNARFFADGDPRP